MAYWIYRAQEALKIPSKFLPHLPLFPKSSKHTSSSSSSSRSKESKSSAQSSPPLLLLFLCAETKNTGRARPKASLRVRESLDRIGLLWWATIPNLFSALQTEDTGGGLSEGFRRRKRLSFKTPGLRCLRGAKGQHMASPAQNMRRKSAFCRAHYCPEKNAGNIDALYKGILPSAFVFC